MYSSTVLSIFTLFCNQSPEFFSSFKTKTLYPLSNNSYHIISKDICKLICDKGCKVKGCCPDCRFRIHSEGWFWWAWNNFTLLPKMAQSWLHLPFIHFDNCCLTFFLSYSTSAKMTFPKLKWDHISLSLKSLGGFLVFWE